MVVRGLEAHRDVGRSGVEQRGTVACREDHFTSRAGDDAFVRDCISDQIDVAARRRPDFASVCQRPGPATKCQLAAQKIGVGEVERRSYEAGDINPCARSEENAVGVDEENPPVAAQAAENGAGVGAGDAIENA